MKSINSQHTATREQIIIRTDDVENCGTLLKEVWIGSTMIKKISFGRLIYIITYLCGVVVSFELENVYCFKF